jgi:hypothetical protein
VDEKKSPENWKNFLSELLKNIAVFLGKGKIIYSLFFLIFLFTNYPNFNFYTASLLSIWCLVLLINPNKTHTKFTFKQINNPQTIGQIFGVISKNMFLIKIYEDQKDINRFDIVKSRYSMENDSKKIIEGVVFDTYYLNDSKWAKILQLRAYVEDKLVIEKNNVIKITDKTEIEIEEQKLKVNQLVGIVIEGSSIQKIKFEYSKKTDDIQEGDLIELTINSKRLFYQVINGFTNKEELEGENLFGYIQGEAIQLGEWTNEDASFQKYGWVPSINTPIFIANTSNIPIPKIEYPYFCLGKIPGTTLPSIINLNDAISHHTAILGVTGAGKSFIAKEIINQIKVDTKIICIDFNNEFVNSLDPKPENIICDDIAKNINKNIDLMVENNDKYPGNRKPKKDSDSWKLEVYKGFKQEIERFLDDPSSNIKIFELPDVSNTTSILEYTKCFFRTLFSVAKGRLLSNQSTKICVVLEEAHTIIPEWNFLGSSDKNAQGVVNSIGQIALQGRKYGIGFLVIAQRTANVSKTVLTQCNSVICFQAFDDTSYEFLSNYLGKDMTQSLSTVKKYHAIVAGKSLKSNIPMIVDLTR